MDKKEAALAAHRRWAGKIEVVTRAPITNRAELAVAYTPGVAEPCLEIQKDVSLSYVYTRRSNLVAVITDGTAVLGLGDIGPEAAMPVMEGKCALFKTFADVDAVPLCVRTKDPDEFVRTVELLAGSFGGINLEDISAPRCFEIERRLKQSCGIPVFHDDQHGTAVVVLAAMLNALKVVDKKPEELKVVVSGVGAAGGAIIRLLLGLGVKNIVACNRHGAIYAGMDGLDSARAELARMTNPACERGTLREVMRGADVFIGVSAPGIVDGDMVRSMAEKPIVLAMANPVPEIMPDEAIAAGAAVVGTGRSDFRNQINNVLAFPGIFRGALDSRAPDITEPMKLAAAYAIASLVSDDERCADYVIPDVFDKRVAPAVAEAVSKAAKSADRAE